MILLHVPIRGCLLFVFSLPSALSGLEQSLLATRLGPAALFNPKHASMHWVLDTTHPGHMEVGKKLVAAAVASGELPNMWNLQLRGGWSLFVAYKDDADNVDSMSLLIILVFVL